MASPRKATPRTLIMGVLANKDVSQSTLRPKRTASRITSSPSRDGRQPSVSLRSSPRKNKNESETPRTLIQGFLRENQTAAPSSRKRSRVTPSPVVTNKSRRSSSTSKAPLSSRRRSPRKSAIMNAMRLNQTVSEETPRTSIKNFLAQATDETPARWETTESTTTSSEVTKKISMSPLKQASVLKPPTPGSERRPLRRSRDSRKQTSLQSFAEGVQSIRANQTNESSVYEDEEVSGLESIEEEDDREMEGRDEMGAAAQTKERIADIDSPGSDLPEADLGDQVDGPDRDEGDDEGMVDEQDADDDEYADDDDDEGGDDQEGEVNQQHDDVDDDVDDVGDVGDEGDPSEEEMTDAAMGDTNSTRQANMGDNSVFEKSRRSGFVQQTLDHFVTGKTPANRHKPRPVSPSLITPVLVKQARQPTPKKKKVPTATLR